MNMNIFFKCSFVVLLYPFLMFSATWTHSIAAKEPISTRPVICADPQGHLHVAWTANDPYGETLHYATNQSGVWTYIRQVAGGSSNTAYMPSITVDRYGFAYIVARFYSYNYSIRYFTNAYEPSSYWPGMTAMGNGHYHESSIEADSDGNAHVFAQEDTWGSNVFYQNHDLADVVIEGGTSQFFATAIDPNDVLHFVGSHANNIWYTYHDGMTGWSEADSIDQLEISAYHPSVCCDERGYLHVVFASTNGIYYINNTSGDWSVPEQATSGGIFPNVAIDENGKAHIAYYTQVENGGLFYVNNLSGGWSAGEFITAINTDASPATEDVTHVESKIALDLKNSTVNIVYIDGGNTVTVAHTDDYELRAIPDHDTTSSLTSLIPDPVMDTLSTSASGSVDLLSFRILDNGGDGLSTLLQELVFQRGPGMSNDLAFNDVFESMSLSCSDASNTTCNVYGSKVLAGTKGTTFKSIPECGYLDFTLSGSLKKPLENMDGKSLQIKINGLNDVIIDSSGSSFSRSSQNVLSDTLLFRVIPDHFVFLNLGDDLYNENLIVGWWMQVRIVDAAGNIATGVSDVEVTLSAVEPDGSTPASLPLQSTESLTKILTNGAANWNNITYPGSGQIRVQASCDLLTAASDTVTVMPFHSTLLITADDTISEFLDDAGIAHDHYHEDNYQFPTASKITDYDHILLCPSFNYAWYIDSTKIKYYLESGTDSSRKSMLAFGEWGLGNIGDSPFAKNYFGASRGQLFSHSGAGISGVGDDPVSDGIHLSLSEGNLYRIDPLPGAARPILHEDQTQHIVGTRYEEPAFRTVLMTPEFRNLTPDVNRTQLFAQLLEWFNTYVSPTYPPVLAGLPDINMIEDETTRLLLENWHSYVTDPDTPIDSLQWQILDNDHVEVRIESDTLILTPEANYFGLDTIIVRVSDGFYADDDTVLITVAPVNDPPGLFSLLLPANGTDIPDTASLFLSWEEAVDIDDDTLYYQVQFHSAGFDSTIDLMNTINLTLEDLSVFPSDTTIFWSVSVSDPDDSTTIALNSPMTFIIIHIEVSLTEHVPCDYTLLPCYPNPFNPGTTVTYGLPAETYVRISVFDLNGRQRRTLVNHQKTRGFHKVDWDAFDMPSGVYIIMMHAGEFVRTQKVVLLK